MKRTFTFGPVSPHLLDRIFGYGVGPAASAIEHIHRGRSQQSLRLSRGIVTEHCPHSFINSMRVGIVVIAALCCGPRIAEAGPWVPKARHFYLQLAERFDYANERFDAHGVRRAIETVAPNDL